MHSVRELLGTVDVRRVRELVRGATASADDGDVAPSPLYFPTRKERAVDFDLRRSRYRLLRDATLFDAVNEDLLAPLREQMPAYDLHLLRNDATHIVYEPGGFFAVHADFLSFRSNFVEEFTLIVSLTAPTSDEPVQGGETVLHFNPSFQLASRATTAPDSALLFRKDVPHEGRLVQTGRKQILSLNVLGVRRSSPQLLVVTFPHEHVAAAPAHLAPAPSAVADLVRQAAECFVIPSDALLRDFPNSFLAGLLSFEQHAHTGAGEAPPRIVHYACTAVSRAAFAVAMRALNRQSLAESGVALHADALDFLGISSHLIMTLACEAPAPSPTTTWTADSNDVVVCDSPERVRVLTQLAVDRREPWIPFRITFAEADTFWDDEGDPVHVPMQPVLAAAGSRENLLFVRCVLNGTREDAVMPSETDASPFGEEAEFMGASWFDKDRLTQRERDLLRTPDTCITYPDADRWSSREFAAPDETQPITEVNIARALECDKGGHLYSFGLMIAASPEYERKAVLHKGHGVHILPEEAVVLPGGSGPPAIEPCSPCFHVHADGGVVFNEDEARRAARAFYAAGVCRKALAAVSSGKLGFVVPQHHELASDHFCNETVYGRTTLLHVAGVFRAAGE